MHAVCMLHGESAVLSVPTHVPLTFFQKMIKTQELSLTCVKTDG